jgi:hypothetical protein
MRCAVQAVRCTRAGAALRNGRLDLGTPHGGLAAPAGAHQHLLISSAYTHALPTYLFPCDCIYSLPTWWPVYECYIMRPKC